MGGGCGIDEWAVAVALASEDWTQLWCINAADWRVREGVYEVELS